MGLFGPSEQAVRDDLANQRAKDAVDHQRQVGINVNNYENAGAAQVHQQKNEMEDQKMDEINSMKNATQKKLDEISESAYQKKRELANEASATKIRVLQEEELKKKQLEMENDQRVKEQKVRTDGLRRDQDAFAKQTDETIAQNVQARINETKKTEELHDRLIDEQKKLTEKIDKEFAETEKLNFDTRLQLEEAHNKQEAANFEAQKEGTVKVYQQLVDRDAHLINLRIMQSTTNELIAVDTEITDAKRLVAIIQTDSDSISESLNAEMDANTKSLAVTKLELVYNNVVDLSNNMTTMERKSTNIVNKVLQSNLIEKIKGIRKMATEAKSTITDAKRELKQSGAKFDIKLRKKFDKRILAMIEAVNAIEQLDTGSEAFRQEIRNAAQGDKKAAINQE